MAASPWHPALLAAAVLQSAASYGFQKDEPATTFDKVMVSLKGETFDEGKLAVLATGTDSDAFDCLEIAEFLKQFTFSSGRLQALTIVSQTKNCTGASSIIKPDACDALAAGMSGFDKATAEKLLGNAVPGARAEFILDGAISEMVQLQEATALGSEAIEVLLSEMKQTIVVSEKLTSIERFLQETPKQFTALQVTVLARNLEHENARMDFARMIRQRVVGLSCANLLQILDSLPFTDGKLSFIEEMSFNLVDPQNKHVLIAQLAFQGSKTAAARILGDICGRSPPNNPTFGRVEGDPVVLIIDKSGSMTTRFELGGKSYSRDEFCMQELEAVLKGLLPTSRFNVIPFSSDARPVFGDAVLVSEENINEAIAKTADFGVGGSTNAYAALKRAYGFATSPQQIYFLSDGVPNKSSPDILAAIDSFDKGRRIPVNSIVFALPGYDEGASKFMESVAKKTGGFFRAVESKLPAEGVTLTPITDAIVV